MSTAAQMEFYPIPELPGYSVSRDLRILGPRGLRKLDKRGSFSVAIDGKITSRQSTHALGLALRARGEAVPQGCEPPRNPRATQARPHKQPKVTLPPVTPIVPAGLPLPKGPGLAAACTPIVTPEIQAEIARLHGENAKLAAYLRESGAIIHDLEARLAVLELVF